MRLERRQVEARLAAVERSWGPRMLRVDNGQGLGRRQIDVRHLGGLALTIEPDQFLDLGDASWDGELVSFVAPTTSLRSESWGRRWSGGLLTTCGLGAVGQAPEADGGMHGRAHTIPANLTRAEGRWEGDRYVVEVAGLLREAGIFEDSLSVSRTITAEHGVSRVRLSDVVRNEGFLTAPVKLLYHINLGWPLVDAGTLVRASGETAGLPPGVPWTAELVQPIPGEPESVDVLRAIPAADGWASVVVQGPEASVTIRFASDALPFLTLWRSPAAGSYALGIEPGTCWPAHVDGPHEANTGRLLDPGESLATAIDITFQKTPR